jgi:uncharacterized membrane protein YbhN (UPF0104 family)
MNFQTLRNFLSSWFTGDKWKDVLKIVLALALMGFIFSRTNLQDFLSLRDIISWPWLLISLIVFLALTVVKAAQYWVLFDRRLPYPQVLRVVTLQNALTNLVSNAAGIASYLTMLRIEQNVKLRRSGAIFIVTKAGDLFSMAFFLLLSAWLVWARVNVLHQLVLVVLAAVFLALLVFWTAVLLRQKFIFQLQRIMHWTRLDRLPIAARGLNMLQSVAEQEQRTVIRMFLLGLALSMAYMTLTMVYGYSRIQTFQIPLDLWAVVFVASLMQFVSIIPIQIFGGLGINEVTLLYLYGLFGITQTDLPAILVGQRVLFYLFNLALLLYMPIDTFASRFGPAGKDKADRWNEG